MMSCTKQESIFVRDVQLLRSCDRQKKVLASTYRYLGTS